MHAPTGYSFNLDGANIYLTLAALFIAQATNALLLLTDQVLAGGRLTLLQRCSGRVGRQLHGATSRSG